MNKKTLTPLVLAIIIALSVILGGVLVYQYWGAPKQEKDNTYRYLNYNTYKNYENKFQIDYPNEWIKDIIGRGTILETGQIIGFYPAENKRPDLYSPRIIVWVKQKGFLAQQFPVGPQSFKEKIEEIISIQKGYGMNIIESNFFYIQGTEAHKLVWKTKNTVFTEVQFLRNDTLYTFKFDFDILNEKQYENMNNSVQYMINSIKIL